MTLESISSVEREQQRHHWEAVARHERRRVRRWALFAITITVGICAVVYFAIATIGV